MSKKIGLRYRGLCVDVIPLKSKPLYNNFYLTDLGIFRFDNPMWYGKTMVLFSPNLTLPRITKLIKGDDK